MIQRFHRLHGLQGEEFNFGAHYRDRSGKLFFGGAAGFNAFYPEVLEFNERPPRVVLTQFLKLNEPGVAGVPEERIDRLSLSHKEDVITLKFAALDFADPRANRYEYKLDGFDNDWVRADERRAATYTNLPGGQLRVPRARQQQRRRVEHAGPRAAHRRRAFAVAVAMGLFRVRAGGGAACCSPSGTRSSDVSPARRPIGSSWNSRSAIAPTSWRSATANSGREPSPRDGELHAIRSPASPIAATSCTSSRNCWPQHKGTPGPGDHDHRSRCAEAHQRPARSRRAATSSSSKSRKTLRQAIRPDDVLVRWGGDEFVVVAQAQHVEHAIMLAERVRERVAKMKCVAAARRGGAHQLLHRPHLPALRSGKP